MSDIKIRYKQENGYKFIITAMTEDDCHSKISKIKFYKSTLSELLKRYGLFNDGYETVYINGHILNGRGFRKYLRNDLSKKYKLIENLNMNKDVYNEIDLGYIDINMKGE